FNSITAGGKSSTSESSELEVGRWKLDVGSWTLEVGRWKLDVGSWTLEVGRWKLDVGSWTLEVGRWTLDVGRWTLDVGRWTLDVESFLTSPNAQRSTLNAQRSTSVLVFCPRSSVYLPPPSVLRGLKSPSHLPWSHCQRSRECCNEMA